MTSFDSLKDDFYKQINFNNRFEIIQNIYKMYIIKSNSFLKGYKTKNPHVTVRVFC